MTAPAVGEPLLRLSRWAAMASGITAAVGLAFLIAMFTAFALGATSPAMTFGRINDTLVLVSYLLVAPIALHVHGLARPYTPVLAWLATLIGVGAIAAIVILQWLLISGALTFEEQVGPVSVAILVLGAWFVMTGFLARPSGALPNGVRMGLLAATYAGFPIWAFWMAQRLRGSPGAGQ